MAKYCFEVDVDLQGNQLLNARIHNITNADITGGLSGWTDGQIGYVTDNGDKHLGIWDSQLSAFVKLPRLDRGEAVTGQWSYSPASAQAPFALGANAYDQKVLRFNADLCDGYHVDEAATASTIVARDNAGRIKVAAPSANDDAANKAWVIDTIYGITAVKQECRAKSTANVTISNPGTNTFDGVNLTSGQRLFLADQSTASQNGIYIFNGSGSALTRATDADTSDEVLPGMTVFVSEGTTWGNSRWQLTTDDTIVLGTTSLVFAQISGAGEITAGNGIVKVGNTLHFAQSSTYTTGGLFVASSTSAVTQLGLGTANQLIGMSTAGTGYEHKAMTVNSSGQVTAGTWQGTVVDLQYGGTGANLSGATTGGIAYKGASALAFTGALSGILQGNGGSAPTAITGTGNRIVKWGSSAPYLADGSITDTGTLLSVSSSVSFTIGDTNTYASLAVAAASLGVTQTNTNGLALVSLTAASAGAQQISPALRWRGYGWKTNSTAASQSVDFQAYVVPVQGAAAPTGYLTFRADIAGGGYTELLRIGSAALTASKVVFTDANLQLSSSGTVGLVQGGTAADLSGATTGGLAYKGASAMAFTGALNGIVQGNGSSAPTAINGTSNRLSKWSSSAPYLTDSLLSESPSLSTVYLGASLSTAKSALAGAYGTIQNAVSGVDNWEMMWNAYYDWTNTTYKWLRTNSQGALIYRLKGDGGFEWLYKVGASTADASFSSPTSIMALSVAGLLTLPGVLVSGLTASKVVFTDGSKALTSSGTVGLVQGGTGADLSAAGAAGGLVYSTGSAMSVTAAGTSGRFACSGGAGAPTWFDLFGTANTWSASQTVSLATSSTRFQVADIAWTLGPSNAATSNTTHKCSPYLNLRASVWDGSAALNRGMVVQVQGISGVNDSYGMEFASSNVANILWLDGKGGCSVGAQYSPGALGVLNVATGFRVGGTTATSGKVLRSDGTNFISATLAAADIGSGANLTAGTGISISAGSGTAALLVAATLAVDQSFTPTWSAVHTFTLAPVMSALTASKVVFTDGSKALTSSGTVGVVQGGTGLTSATAGDLLYASATNTWASLGIGSNGKWLKVVTGAPAWTTLTAADIGSGANLTAGTGIAISAGSGTAALLVAATLAVDQTFTPTWSGAHIWTAGLTARKDSLGTTQTNTSGLTLENTTAASAGNQQISPALRWRGYGWKTNATAASQSVDFQAYVVPVQGAAAPTGYLTFRADIAGGGYTELLRIGSAALTASKVVFTDANLQLSSSGTVGLDQGGTGTATAFTAGSVVFAGASGVYSQNNAKLFWDNSNFRLGLGTAAPGVELHLYATSGTPQLRLENAAAGDSGWITWYSNATRMGYIQYVNSTTQLVFDAGGATAGFKFQNGAVNIAALSASKVVFTDASKNLTSSGTVGADQGGTGLASYTAGDMLYATGTTTFAKLSVNSGKWLKCGASAPAWTTLTAADIGSGANLTAGTGIAISAGSGTAALLVAATLAVDQTFTPTWSGAHTFGNTVSMSALTASTLLQLNGSKNVVSSNDLPGSATIGGVAIARLVSATITGDGSTATFSVTHNLNSKTLAVTVWRGADENAVQCQVRAKAGSLLSAIEILFNTAPANAATYRVAIAG